jgi:His-Xaa-Ser system protein HxsD
MNNSINLPVIKENEGICIIKLTPKTYDINVIYTAAYAFIDKAYFLFDGDPEKEIEVIIKPKKKEDLENIGFEFYNELLNYAVYNSKSQQTKDIRTALIQKALFSEKKEEKVTATDKEIDEELKKIEETNFDDIDSVAIPWEKKHTEKDY